jgi:hypothetical protein
MSQETNIPKEVAPSKGWTFFKKMNVGLGAVTARLMGGVGLITTAPDTLQAAGELAMTGENKISNTARIVRGLLYAGSLVATRVFPPAMAIDGAIKMYEGISDLREPNKSVETTSSAVGTLVQGTVMAIGAVAVIALVAAGTVTVGTGVAIAGAVGLGAFGLYYGAKALTEAALGGSDTAAPPADLKTQMQAEAKKKLKETMTNDLTPLFQNKKVSELQKALMKRAELFPDAVDPATGNSKTRDEAAAARLSSEAVKGNLQALVDAAVNNPNLHVSDIVQAAIKYRPKSAEAPDTSMAPTRNAQHYQSITPAERIDTAFNTLAKPERAAEVKPEGKTLPAAQQKQLASAPAPRASA